MHLHHQAGIAKMSCLILFLMMVSWATAQDDRQQIHNIREASNQALQSYDHEKVLSFLTDDALTTVSNGTLLSGKEALRKFILAAGNNKMYWIRTPVTVEINQRLGLAWENGAWKGYDPEKGKDPVVGGNYAAMWTKASGQWLIKSQLFVALE